MTWAPTSTRRCEDAPADAKGEVGAEAGLDFAGQRHGRLSVARLHKFGVHQYGALDRRGGALIAGTQRRRQKRERDCGTHRPRNGLRMRDGTTHGGFLLWFWLDGGGHHPLALHGHARPQRGLQSTIGSGAAGGDRAIGAPLALR